MSGSGFDPGIDVCVTNYRTPDDLQKFLGSYVDQLSGVETTLNVIDVDPLEPYDGLFDKVGEWYETEENIGYARACNFGASLGNREVIALFNADTELFDYTLDECYNALQENPGWGVLGQMQVSRGGRITSSGTEVTHTNLRPRGWRSRQLDRYRDVIECPTVSGSAYFIKRECWNELQDCPIYRSEYPDAEGAFLPTQHYYEETWCSYHAFWHGWRVVYYGLSIMIHEWHQASKIGSATERTLLPESQKMFREMCDAHGIAHD